MRDSSHLGPKYSKLCYCSATLSASTLIGAPILKSTHGFLEKNHHISIQESLHFLQPAARQRSEEIPAARYIHIYITTFLYMRNVILSDLHWQCNKTFMLSDYESGPMIWLILIRICGPNLQSDKQVYRIMMYWCQLYLSIIWNIVSDVFFHDVMNREWK